MNLSPNEPMFKLFIFFILDVIKKISKEEEKFIKSLNLKEIFQGKENDWKLTIKEVLSLSNTIEIAIKDLWLKNSKIAYEKNIELSPIEFATFFIENFYKENTQIDVWKSKKELEKARENIKNSYLNNE